MAQRKAREVGVPFLFLLSAGKVHKARLRTPWGFSGHLTGGRAGWRAGRGRCGGERVNFFRLCDPAVWKQTPYLLLPQLTAALLRTMAGYRPVLTSDGTARRPPGQAGVNLAKRGSSLAHRGPAASTSHEGTPVQPWNRHLLAPREAQVSNLRNWGVQEALS